MTFTVKPLVDALFVYLKQHESEVGTEKLRAAFTYALNQEKYLSRFAQNVTELRAKRN